MEQRGAWRPLQGPRSGAESFVTSPFTRLARVHALSTAGDALVAAALSGQLFFSVSPEDGRNKVLLYLLLTMAPFALVSPLIGPALDRARSGRRWMVIGSVSLRAVACFLMIGDVDGLLLFPEAFAVLVLQKGYAVARSAMVPSTVNTDTELVEANSKLSLLSGVMGFVAGIPGLLVLKFGGPEAVLAAAVAVFTLGSVVGLRLPKAAVAPLPAGEAERAELRSAGVLLAASAMGLLRGIVGFLTFLLAFDLRQEGTPRWQFGVVAATGIAGGLVGAIIAPRLRRVVTEERILIGVLLLTVGAGLASVFLGGVRGAVLLGASVGIAASTGKLAFDSIVQRDAPDANRGRSFARFETRFQLIWVVGALIPVSIAMPASAGFIIVTAVAAFAAFSYTVGQLAARHRSGVEPSAATARAVEIEQRLSGATKAIRRRMRRRDRTAAKRDETPAGRS